MGREPRFQFHPHEFYTKQIKLHTESRRLELESELNPSSLLEHTIYPWANKNEGIIPSEFTDSLTPEQLVKDSAVRDASESFRQEFETQRASLDGVPTKEEKKDLEDKRAQNQALAQQQSAGEAPDPNEYEIKHDKYRSIPEGVEKSCGKSVFLKARWRLIHVNHIRRWGATTIRKLRCLCGQQEIIA